MKTVVYLMCWEDHCPNANKGEQPGHDRYTPGTLWREVYNKETGRRPAMKAPTISMAEAYLAEYDFRTRIGGQSQIS